MEKIVKDDKQTPETVKFPLEVRERGKINLKL